MNESGSPFCPIPDMGYCIRERCPFWDEERQECTGTCFDAQDQAQPDYSFHPDGPCIITFYEDPD
jgi:hypothetical protein